MEKKEDEATMAASMKRGCFPYTEMMSGNTKECIKTMYTLEKCKCEVMEFLEFYYKNTDLKPEELQKRLRTSQKRIERGFGRIEDVIREKTASSIHKSVCESCIFTGKVLTEM